MVVQYNPDPFIQPGMGIGAVMKSGFGRAGEYIQEGTATAAEMLRDAYQKQFQARVGGLVGGFDEMQSRMNAQTASQDLSPDVIQRLMYAPGMQLQQQVGQARGEAEGGLDFDLARLYKGTAGEFAGLTRDHLLAWVNKEIAKRAAEGAMKGGLMSMFGTLGGAALGSFAGPGGAMAGAQLGGSLGGSGGGYYDDFYGSGGP